MSIKKSLRARAAAALVRSARALTPADKAADANAPQWRIESLEPKLLLSADAMPSAHLLMSADPTQAAPSSNQAATPPAASPDDTIVNAPGNNLYLFGIGDGETLVTAYADPNLGKLNTLQFKPGVAAADVNVARAVDSQLGGNIALVFSIAGTPDTITFNGFLHGGTPANEFKGLQSVQFDDGTQWDISQLLFLLGMGTAGNDSLSGDGNDNLLNGGAGDDVLHGNGGFDSLYGGSGNDTLDASYGAAICDGGAGSDWLNPGPGNSTYLFGRGDGQDTLGYVYDGDASHISTLQFKAGIAPADVSVRQVYDNQFGGNKALAFSLSGSEDSFTVNAFFYSDDPLNVYNRLQRVRFDDGTEWDIPALLAMFNVGTPGDDHLLGGSGDDTLSGAAGNDTIKGLGGNDSLHGDAGDDTLDGGEGDDLLDGGTGDDRLNAGSGNNTFPFGRGDGRDRLYYNYDATAGRINTLQVRHGRERGHAGGAQRSMAAFARNPEAVAGVEATDREMLLLKFSHDLDNAGHSVALGALN